MFYPFSKTYFVQFGSFKICRASDCQVRVLVLALAGAGLSHNDDATVPSLPAKLYALRCQLETQTFTPSCRRFFFLSDTGFKYPLSDATNLPENNSDQ